MTTVIIFLEAVFTDFKISTEAIEVFKQLLLFSWFLITYQVVQAFTRNLNLMKNMPWFWRLNIWIFVIISIFALPPGKSQEFIYFAF